MTVPVGYTAVSRTPFPPQKTLANEMKKAVSKKIT